MVFPWSLSLLLILLLCKVSIITVDQLFSLPQMVVWPPAVSWHGDCHLFPLCARPLNWPFLHQIHHHHQNELNYYSDFQCNYWKTGLDRFKLPERTTHLGRVHCRVLRRLEFLPPFFQKLAAIYRPDALPHDFVDILVESVWLWLRIEVLHFIRVCHESWPFAVSSDLRDSPWTCQGQKRPFFSKCLHWRCQWQSGRPFHRTDSYINILLSHYTL